VDEVSVAERHPGDNGVHHADHIVPGGGVELDEFLGYLASRIGFAHVGRLFSEFLRTRASAVGGTSVPR